MMTIEQVVSLTHELKRLGCKCSLSVSVHLPLDEEEQQPAQPSLAPKATNQTRMWALNRLKGAPGQPNRDTVRHFLFFRGWIGSADEPEVWNLDFVPCSKPELAQLAGEMLQWEVEQRKTAAING